MRTFTFTASFEGEVVINFNDDNGLLCGLDMSSAVLSIEQQTWFLKHAPKNIAELNELQKITPNAKIQESFITFDKFWITYDDRLNSSKKKTYALWIKMSKSEQQKATNHISKYFRSIPQGTRKKYAETYLRAELWNN